MILISSVLSSCVSLRPYPPQSGMYHVVQKGETLWGISRSYNVELEEIVKSNHIRNKQRIYAGTRLFIPQKTAPAQPETVSFLWPAEGKIILGFGTHANQRHQGIDIKTENNKNIKASRDGTVIFSGPGPSGYGNTLIIKHDETFTTVYAKIETNLVKSGDTVKQGDTIATLENSTKSFLHFEIRKNGTPANPLFYLP